MDFSKNVWVRISFRIKDWVVLFLNSNLRLNVLFLKRSHPQSQLEYPLRTITLKMTKNQRFWFPIWTKKFWADQTFCWVQLLQKLHQVEKIFRTFLFFKFQKKKICLNIFWHTPPKKKFFEILFRAFQNFFHFSFSNFSICIFIFEFLVWFLFSFLDFPFVFFLTFFFVFFVFLSLARAQWEEKN